MRAVWWMAGVVVAALLVSTVLYGVFGDGHASSWLDVALSALLVVGMASVPLAVGRRSGRGWRETFGFVASRRALSWGAAGAIASLTTIVLLTEAIRLLFGAGGESATAEVAASFDNGVQVLLFVTLAVLGAAFAEEIAFRGLLWGALVNRGRASWAASVVSAIPFAILHVEPGRVVPLLCSGIVLGLVRQVGGLGASMFAHCLVNLVPATLLLFTL
jgi:membrane protease YdiL (CAAX protease family)